MNTKNNTKKSLEKLTFNRVKKLSYDEPSAGFTQNVMQSVLSQARPISAVRSRNYWYWLSGLIPIIIVIAWYLRKTFQWTSGTLDHLWISITNFVQPSFSAFFACFNQLKNISIQPVVFICFAAIFSLLVIEQVIRRARHTI